MPEKRKDKSEGLREAQGAGLGLVSNSEKQGRFTWMNQGGKKHGRRKTSRRTYPLGRTLGGLSEAATLAPIRDGGRRGGMAHAIPQARRGGVQRPVLRRQAAAKVLQTTKGARGASTVKKRHKNTATLQQKGIEEVVDSPWVGA